MFSIEIVTLVVLFVHNVLQYQLIVYLVQMVLLYYITINVFKIVLQDFTIILECALLVMLLAHNAVAQHLINALNVLAQVVLLFALLS